MSIGNKVDRLSKVLPPGAEVKGMDVPADMSMRCLTRRFRAI